MSVHVRNQFIRNASVCNVMFPQFKAFEALQTVKSSIVSLCMIFKSIFEDFKVSYLIETKGLPIAFAKVLRISQP